MSSKDPKYHRKKLNVKKSEAHLTVALMSMENKILISSRKITQNYQFLPGKSIYLNVLIQLHIL